MPGERTISDRQGHGMRTSLLSDFEFRVWIQYQNSADDFGVMRMWPVQIQSDNAALAKRPQVSIQRALDALVTVRLVSCFHHQGIAYLYQKDWQAFQGRRYVRRTTLPQPSPEDLTHCDAQTQYLFSFHPGGATVPTFPEKSQKISKIFPKSSENSSETFCTHAISTSTSTSTEKEQEQKPSRPDAFTLGVNGHSRTVPPDEAWEGFKAAYPGKGRHGGFMAQQRFLDACQRIGLAALMASVGSYAQSDKVARGMVVSLEKFLEKEYWLQESPPPVHPDDEAVSAANEKQKREIARGAARRKSIGL